MPVIGAAAPPPPTGIGTPQIIQYSELNTAYPARPAGLPAGLAIFKGPIEPPDWLDGDDWIDIS